MPSGFERWHIVVAAGVALDVSQQPIPPGEDFTYEFVVPNAGTYFYHSHVGVQLDSGLYGPLIVDDPTEDVAYDREYTVVLDDWLDGLAGTPDEVLGRLRADGITQRPTPHSGSLLAGLSERVRLSWRTTR